MKIYLTALTTAVFSTIGLSQEHFEAKKVELTIENDTVKVKKYNLNEVVVDGKNKDKELTSGKAKIKEMDLPQASSIVTSEVLKQQQVTTLTDVLKNANGVYIMGTTGGYQEEIASRGFNLGSNNTFKNGIRYYNGMMIETSGLEKVEFLKGSTAMLYGNVAPGGIMNLVTKKPKYEFGGEAGFAQSSFNTYQPSFDVYNAIGKNKKVAFRVNGSYTNGESFRNFVQSERYYFNPSFEVKLNEKTKLLVEADYINDSRTPDFGAGVIDYEVVDLPRDRFLGVTWGYYDSEQFSNTITLTHKINDAWNINFINGIRYFKTELFSNTRPNTSGGGVLANGDWDRSIQKADAKDNYFTQQANLNGLFATGKIEHNFLFGADVENFKNYATRYQNVAYDQINIFEEYDPSLEEAIPTMTATTLTTAPTSRFGVYVQDLVTLSEKWKVLAGVRYTYQDTESNVFTYSTNKNEPSNQYDDAFSPRFGLIYQPTKNHTLFATYSNSFETNSGQDENGKALEPSIIDQYEIGVKNKFFNNKLGFNVIAYQITNDKNYQQSLANNNSYNYIKVLAGTVRSQGVEIDVNYSAFKGFSIIAGYSFNETKFLDSEYYVEGSLLRYNPKNTANLSFNYEFLDGSLKGLSFGLINTYFGTRYAGRSTRVQVNNDSRQLIYLSDYFQSDATASYTIKSFTLRAKLGNIFNELNYNAHDDNSLNPIAPRNYSLALAYNF
ncbi:TonB-dependent siderophore receptor [Flavobacterium okayamense]|uniref:TonB-dependent receptor n=1 Tax=Flavobacterium okayamense TaxID=2830782 RepID=A0ABM7SEG3_9FLAO|nr:TonB-dependent receptor [Flavobacterium okayamense]BCY29587.1 TonB-dependent receptor [Flavobacterium okayamense]